jgi:hypothetical protein
MEQHKKTLEEHREFIRSLVRVAFFFARRLKETDPETPIREHLRDRTPLYFHALNYRDFKSKWDNPDCRKIGEKATELQDLPPAEFEERMAAEIDDLAMERAERFYPESVGVGHPEGYPEGSSLKYDPPSEKRPPNYCNFHIANAIAPRSIFEDPAYLPACFRKLMEMSEKEYGFDTLHTGTWLNDHPRWLALFPQEWHDNLSPRKNTVGWTFGNWGQLVTARGTFNEKAGQYLREHGELKYKCRASRCSFAAMRAHLVQWPET